jgi:hypothetical protein
MSANPYEPFELPAVAPQTAIDTIPANDKNVSNWLDSWKQLRATGWTVTVLLSPDSKKLIGLASRGSIHLTLKHEPPLHSAMLLQTLGATWTVDPSVPGECGCGCRGSWRDTDPRAKTQ